MRRLPVEAIDVMADGLATLTGATYVQFLITNITHRPSCDSPDRTPTRPGSSRRTATSRSSPCAARSTTRCCVGRRSCGSTWRRRAHPRAGHGERRRPGGDRPACRARPTRWSSPTSPRSPRRWPGSSSPAGATPTSWTGRRTPAPFSLAAEIQRRLLPGSYTCETDRFTVAGWLEPANAVGGDTFDYSLNRDTLHLR